MGIVLNLKPAQSRYECSVCGTEAACDCGAQLVPAGTRAAAALAANPEKSDRAIAAEIGVSKDSVRRARNATGADEPVGKRTGRDGKTRQMPARPQIVMPTEEEAENSWQETLYDEACLLLERMADETRQRFLAHIRRKYGEG